MKEQCRQAILNYANEEMQRNAILLGEHTKYVQIVLQLFRDSYQEQIQNGATEFIIDPIITQYLDSIKPW